MPHLTDATIRRLPTPAKGNKVYYDDEVPGFGCRVTAAAARAFILNYVVKGSGSVKISTASTKRRTDSTSPVTSSKLSMAPNPACWTLAMAWPGWDANPG